MKRNRGLIIIAALLICALIYLLSGCKCPEQTITSRTDTTYVDRLVKVREIDTLIEIQFCTDTIIRSVNVPVYIKVRGNVPQISSDTIYLYGFGKFRAYICGQNLCAQLDPADTTVSKVITLKEYRELINRVSKSSSTVNTNVCLSGWHSFTNWFFWIVCALIAAYFGLNLFVKAVKGGIIN